MKDLSQLTHTELLKEATSLQKRNKEASNQIRFYRGHLMKAQEKLISLSK